MEVRQTDIPGLTVIVTRVFQDDRGSFVKTFHEPTFSKLGLPTHFPEQFYSVSQKNVVRGMHFQTPPHDHAKVVYCAAGKVLDVVVDLRLGSPSYHKVVSIPLDAVAGHIVHIPTGCAHGFLAMSDNAAMFYNVGTVHSPEHDAGIKWDTIEFDWHLDGAAIVSKRDMSFPALQDFRSPFTYV